jgi:Predicted membrane protein
MPPQPTPVQPPIPATVIQPAAIFKEPDFVKQPVEVDIIIEKPAIKESELDRRLAAIYDEKPEPSEQPSEVNDEQSDITEQHIPLYNEPFIPQPPPFIPREKEDESFFEKITGANLLSKIGIVTLVLGISFFVKYAIDQEWINEIGRVGIGLFTGGLIIGIAHKLKAKYHVFSSILVGGGISVFYITITLAFREYELFSQTVSFVMLIVITLFSVLLSWLYDRKELAIFSLLGGFASPLMVSSGAGNYIVLFSYILILNTGMLAVSFKKQWRIIGIISYILTLIFFWTWMFSSFEDQYLNVSLFVTLFFVQFYLLALLDHFKYEKKISVFQVFLILTNNISAFAAYLVVIEEYSSDLRGLITISLAVVNAIVMVLFFKNSRIDRNLVFLIIAIVLSFVSLAIPVQMKGHVITMIWAAESVILLWLWQKSKIKVFYAGFFIITFLTLSSYFFDIINLYSYGTLPILSNRLFVTGVVVLASFVINTLLLKREKAEAVLVNIYKISIIILSYIVMFIELNIQLKNHTDVAISSYFRYVTMAVYTVIYIAVLGFIYNKKVSSNNYIYAFLSLTVLFYAGIFTFLIMNLREDIFMITYDTYPTSYFSIHLAALPALAYVIYLLIKNIKAYPTIFTWFSWLLTTLVVVIFSVETENIVVWMVGNPDNYYDVLYDVHTFGYPILWGIIAMILMIWGLNKKEALLRKISLVFFGLIIVKFYVYDVWKMSQAGRIISFVLLGVILLLVSFLQQKIRTLVKDDMPKESENTD